MKRIINSNGDFLFNALDTYEPIYAEIAVAFIPDADSAPTFNDQVSEEFQRYEQRKIDGQNAVLMLEAKLRVMKLLGVITEESHKGIDALLEPIAIAVERGQWIDGRDKLVALGSELIGQDMYDSIFAQITDYVTENY